jgi:tetratricopeptide (TPR) repeat protein
MSEHNRFLEFLAHTLRRIFGKKKGPLFYGIIFVLMITLFVISYMVYSSYVYNKAIRAYDKRYAKYEALRDFWEQERRWNTIKQDYEKNSTSPIAMFYAYNILRFADNLIPIMDYYITVYERKLWNTKIDGRDTLKTIRDKLSVSLGKGYTLFNIAFRNKDKKRREEAKNELISLIENTYILALNKINEKFDDNFFRNRLVSVVKELEGTLDSVRPTRLYRKALLELFIAYNDVLKDKDKAFTFYKEYEKNFGGDTDENRGLYCFVMFGVGGYYADKKDYMSAIKMYKKATKCDNPSLKDWALFNIAWIYEKLGKKGEAIKIYKTLITKSSNGKIVKESKRNLFFLEGE